MTARLTDAEIAEMESAAKALDGFPGTHQILRFIAECRKRGEELAAMTERAEKTTTELADANRRLAEKERVARMMSDIAHMVADYLGDIDSENPGIIRTHLADALEEFDRIRDATGQEKAHG